MSPRVSVILPSKYPDALERALRNLADTTSGGFEVVVVTPRGVDWTDMLGRVAVDSLVIVESDATGPIATQASGIQHARGEFVLATADDALLEPGWDDAAVAALERHEQLSPPAGPLVIGLRFDLVGTVFGIYYANFPLMRRAAAVELGWYDPTFKRGFGDCDLSLRAWDRGGYCGFTQEKLLTVTADDSRKGATVCDPKDLDLFTSRWKKRFGAGWKLRLDQFNFNLSLSEIELRAGTFHCNDAGRFFAQERGFTPLLIEERARENIVSYRGALYGVPKHIGPVDLSNPADRALARAI